MLTRFDGEGLRLTKSEVPGQGLVYVVTIPASDSPVKKTPTMTRMTTTTQQKKTQTPSQRRQRLAYEATFEFQLEALQPMKGIAVLTGDRCRSVHQFSV